MGFFKKIWNKITDDIVGLDPNGGGVYKTGRAILGDKVADDILGMDPNGGGAIKFYNAAIPLIAGYYGLEAIGGIDAITSAFGSGSGASGTTFSASQLAAANASADPIAYLAAATPGAEVAGAAGGLGSTLSTIGKYAGPAASIGNALIGSDASRKAANTQADAARAAADLEKQMFDKYIELNEPFRRGGLTAQNRLMTLLGLGANGEVAGTSGDGMKKAGGGLIRPGSGGGMETLPNFLPPSAGGDASSADFGKYARGFGMEDFEQDPGYAFRLSEGLKAIDRQAAARGGLISGAALKATTRYGQNQASNEYTNAFNRYQTNRANQLNPLQSLMGAGQTAANTIGTAGQNYANQAGEAYIGAGNAQGSGYIGSANALTGGINQFLNNVRSSGYTNNGGVKLG